MIFKHFTARTISFLMIALFFAACNPNDINAPTITLLGDNPDVVLYKSATSYTDPGYSALDATDGPVTVTVIGVINLNSAGVQSLLYEATDASGNKATANRTVIVDAAPYIAGIYNVLDVNDNGSSPLYSDTVSICDTAYNVVSFKWFGYMNGGSVNATIAGNTMTVYQQTVVCGTPPDNYTFTGFGDFTDSTLFIDYTRVLNNSPITGTGSYVRQ